ncbi:MAG TPA: UvrD-helicase domain-containing protein, partial [Verrucomicrobiae bacterium]|nr:UvrD-helicase domain-containing protein [Verrucomicrobiae bacterium]
LVERCVRCLLEEPSPSSIDEILMVTFTEAAAAEMRQRIRSRIEDQLKSSGDRARWSEQLALFETAHIGTLHSFCLELIREHFYQLAVDPQLSVLAEEEANLLAEEAFDVIFEPHYREAAADEAVQRLLESQGGSDRPLRPLLLRIHHYTQTLPNPSGWFERELARFETPQPSQWEEWFRDAFSVFRADAMATLTALAASNGVARDCLAALGTNAEIPLRTSAAGLLNSLQQICDDCERGKRGAWLKPLEEFCADIKFLASLCPAGQTDDPLAQDWQWARQPMLALLRLARDFSRAYAEAKRELGAADFHDLEQLALRLLWTEENQPSDIARQWRQKLRYVFVDEYQDINAAQDKIIEALSREGAESNRFLVGDVKQSIYRFRLANPKIFQDYARKWAASAAGESADRRAAGDHAAAEDRSAADDRTGRKDGSLRLVTPIANPAGAVIPLVENFRSREHIIDFTNSVFTELMREELGGIAYNEGARLRFGAPEERRAVSSSMDAAGKAELHLHIQARAHSRDSAEGDMESQENADALDLREIEKQARLGALRLRELRESKFSVWDEAVKGFRPAQWRDMAVLLRSPSSTAESYAKEFQRAGIPLRVERGGFYRALEISDLLSLLRIMDNPLQDIPLIALLRSPLVGLSVDDLASVRLAAKGPFWIALLRWQDSNDKNAAEPESARLHARVSRFLKRFEEWRKLARRVSLSRCLDAILAETHYEAWLRTQPRWELRVANVQRLLSLARQFDRFQRQGLFRFLCFVDAQELAEADPEVASSVSDDSVRLMSIHQSKGLEFPIVLLGNVSGQFNFQELRAAILLDEEYGLCSSVQPPESARTYPSLALWLAKKRQKRELFGEELRLLYVAMTRARDKLLLTGSIRGRKLEELRDEESAPEPAPLARARCSLDWLLPWLRRQAGSEGLPDAGERGAFQWEFHDDSYLAGINLPSVDAVPAEPVAAEADLASWKKTMERIEWRYPFLAATGRPAKSSVSALRRWAAEEADGESPRAVTPRRQLTSPGGRRKTKGEISAKDLGTLHHEFLQHVSLDQTDTTVKLRAESERLMAAGLFSPEDARHLDLDAIAAFWNSPAGKVIRENADRARRELSFTAKFFQPELDALLGRPSGAELNDEFSVVQGVADLALFLPEEIWLVDFKTDAITRRDLDEKLNTYTPQLKLYAQALSHIYRKPVTKTWLYFLALKELVPGPASELAGQTQTAGK